MRARIPADRGVTSRPSRTRAAGTGAAAKESAA